MMLKRLSILFVVVAVVQSVWAQQLSDSYYRENPSWIDVGLWASDGEYSAMPQTLSSPFEQFAIYGFSFVSYEFRGEPISQLITRLGAVDVASPLERYPNYTFLNLLRRVPSRHTRLWSNSASEWGADGRSDVYETSPSRLDSKYLLRGQLSTRTYLWGTTFSAVGNIADGWYYSLLVGGRWGRDSNIEGLFTDEEQLWLSAERVWGEDVEKRLQLAFMIVPTTRSGRSWNTAEVFELAGNNHYNSYWGWQGDKVRSQRVNREILPTLYASFDVDDKYILSNINISTLIRAGRRSRSRLAWENAPNPLPDYSGSLPSGLADENVGLLAEDVWARGDERFTQIDWQGLYDSNLLNPMAAHYALVAEKEDVLSATVDASAALLGAEGMRLGVRLMHHTTHNHSSPSDLLGAERLVDGFDFYDYNVSHTSWTLYYTFHTALPWGNLSVAAEFGGVQNDYLSATSGRKGTDEALVVRLRAQWSRPLSEQITVGATSRYECEPSYWEDKFGSAKGVLSINPYADLLHMLTGNVWGRGSLGRVTLFATLFANYRNGDSRAESFWGDLWERNVTFLVGGMKTITLGGELSAHIDITPNLTASLHTSLLAARYTDDAVGNLVEYESGRVVAADLPIGVRGRVSLSSPQFTSALVLRYNTPLGWQIGGEWAYAGGRYLEPTLYLLSEDVQRRNLSPEVYNTITTPQSLGNAHSVGLFAYRKRGPLSLSLSVRNLLSSTSAYYDGYQPSRIGVRESDTELDYTPHAPSYQHIYPRYFQMTVGYEF